LSIFSRNSLRFVRCFLNLLSESPNESDIVIIGPFSSCPRPTVAQGAVARFELQVIAAEFQFVINSVYPCPA